MSSCTRRRLRVFAFERTEAVQVRIFDVYGDHLSGGSGKRRQVDARAWADLKRTSSTAPHRSIAAMTNRVLNGAAIDASDYSIRTGSVGVGTAPRRDLSCAS